MRRGIILTALLLFLVAGTIGCYLYNFCEYKSVFVLPGKERNIELQDSLFIYTNLTIESHVGENGDQVMAAYIDFDGFSDSIIVKSLNVKISCVDNPKQYIYMTHIITYVDPLIPEYIDYVSAQKFEALPQHYKIVSLKRKPWNTYRFYFQTKNIELGTIYNLEISASILYHRRSQNFKKEILVRRKKRFVHIQMMT